MTASTKKYEKSPFVVTHRRRKDGIEAMYLGFDRQDGRVLYRVQFMHGGRLQDNVTIRDEALFNETFELAA